MSEARKGALDWPTMKWVLLALSLATGYFDLRIEQSGLQRDVHAIKVLVCRSYPTDSECKP